MCSSGPLCAHNTDGVDVHASPSWIHDCYFSIGDDHVAIHASDALVENCNFGTGHGVSIGSLGVGTALSNITARHITFESGAVDALRIKSDPGASGYLRDVLYEDIRMTNTTGHSVYITMNYPGPDPSKTTTLQISNITFRNITAVSSKVAGQFDCAAESPCTGISVDRVQHTGKKPQGWSCANAHGTATQVTPALTCLLP